MCQGAQGAPDVYNSAALAMPCRDDHSPEGFRGFITGLTTVLCQFFPEPEMCHVYEGWRDELHAAGCAALRLPPWPEAMNEFFGNRTLCQEVKDLPDMGWMSLAPLCPETCGCSDGSVSPDLREITTCPDAC